LRIPSVSEIEELKKLFLNEGVKRIALKKNDDCYIGYLEYGDKIYEIVFSKGDFSNNYVIKLIYKSSDILSCEYMLYNPYGLFVFSEDLRDLVIRAVKKLKIIENFKI
jgi:hypothetical protein